DRTESSRDLNSTLEPVAESRDHNRTAPHEHPSWGAVPEVLEPQELRRTVAAEISNAASRYIAG
ncbi:MAG: hypothetical protein ACI9MC_004269, partial [Kiritimatiellia bacterium]